MYETVQKEAGGRSNSRGKGRLQRCDALLVAPINSAAEEDCEESARARDRRAINDEFLVKGSQQGLRFVSNVGRKQR